MKKIIFTTVAVILTTVLQAQTCRISSVNGKKIIQISVNLDSLEGKTLVTTIKNIRKDSVALDMILENGTKEITPITEMPREDSSEEYAAQNNEVELAENVPERAQEAYSDSTDIAINTEAPRDSSVTGSILNALGLSEVGNLIGALTNKNGDYIDQLVAKTAKSITQADTTKYIPQYPKRKWKWLDNYTTYTRLSLSGIFGRDFGGEEYQDDEKIDSEDYGVNPNNDNNLGGSTEISQVFMRGYYDANGKFVPNPLNFAWSIGALFAMDHQKDYGWSWDIMAKIGIQAGNGITLGADALVGAGSTTYAIYSTNLIDYRVVFHDQWCLKGGVQGWISMNDGGTTSTRLFARIVKSVAPSSLYRNPTADGWDITYVDFDDGSWHVGFAVDYKFGYNTDMKSKRLLASMSTGYNLFGVDKGAVMLYELEKFNEVSPTLNFRYGVGYESSFSGNKLQSFTIGCGWLFKLNQKQKFSYMAKIFAGVGEYMVTKMCTSENKDFKMADTKVQQLCPKVGTHLGISYQAGCSAFSLGLRGGFHKGFDTEYKGYETAETTNLSGFELTPFLGYSLNF